MNVAFIHNDKRIGTGAHHINELMTQKLRERKIRVKNFYPRTSLIEAPAHLKGIANILFFYGLLEHKQEILRSSIVQGTTYSPLPFLAFDVPVVSHFGSTTSGFLKAVPLAKDMEKGVRETWCELRKAGVIPSLNVPTRRPMRDIAEMETYVSTRANAVIATSSVVREELIAGGVSKEKVRVIHNAIEDYWFSDPLPVPIANPHIVFLGRLGSDPFTLKLKGFGRLLHAFSKFPNVPKTMIYMSTHKKLKEYLKKQLPNLMTFVNLRKDLIPNVLRPLCGSILLIPSRYEGFSLSLVEGMSQGLVPVSYRVGVAPEIINDGVNGYLVDTQAQAVRRIKELLADPELRARLSRKAHETSLRFKGGRLAGELEHFYRELVESPQP